MTPPSIELTGIPGTAIEPTTFYVYDGYENPGDRAPTEDQPL